MLVSSHVVNCCCIEIFEIFETPKTFLESMADVLWIAVVLRSLKYLKHLQLQDAQQLQVVNCCCIEIFEIFETPATHGSQQEFGLWIAVVLRSLKYLKHPLRLTYIPYLSCELLLYWDLWNIWNTSFSIIYRQSWVVNCCCIEIFEIFETPTMEKLTAQSSCELLLYWDLWNIWNTRSRQYRPHKVVVNCCCIEIFEIFETPSSGGTVTSVGCELLLYWDLWNIWNTTTLRRFFLLAVVNCCCIEIFEIFETPHSSFIASRSSLWIAVVLRSLKYLKHHTFAVLDYILVVNCCCIEIFEIFETPIMVVMFQRLGCELLLYWDLWNIWNTHYSLSRCFSLVVNCCCIEIFEIFETPR